MGVAAVVPLLQVNGGENITHHGRRTTSRPSPANTPVSWGPVTETVLTLGVPR
jgi:hypothetical protein